MSEQPPSYFHTTEHGIFPSEVGTLRAMTVKSPALQARADLSIYLPEGHEKPDKLPVVTLLHGVWGSHWVWSLKGRAHLTLQHLIDADEIPP